MQRPSFAREKSPSSAASKRTNDARTTATCPAGPRGFINEYIGNLHIVASCPRWQFGTWPGEPAWLLQLEFLFIPGFRLPKAEIDVTFSPENAGDVVTVQAFGPAQLQGSTTTDTIAIKHAITPTITVGTTAANLALPVTYEHDSSYARIWDGFIEGDSSPTPGHATRNHIKWFLSEDPKQSLGVPSKFKPAVIVSCKDGAKDRTKDGAKHGARFTMHCEVTIDPGLRHWLRISKNPLIWAKACILPHIWAKKTRIPGIPVTLDSAAKDGSPVPLVYSAAKARPHDAATQTQDPDAEKHDAATQTQDAAPEGQSEDTDEHMDGTGEASNVDFGTMRLDQWQRIWSSTWPSARVNTLDQTATIFAFLHQSVILGDHAVPTTQPAASAGTVSTSNPETGEDKSSPHGDIPLSASVRLPVVDVNIEPASVLQGVPWQT